MRALVFAIALIVFAIPALGLAADEERRTEGTAQAYIDGQVVDVPYSALVPQWQDRMQIRFYQGDSVVYEVKNSCFYRWQSRIENYRFRYPGMLFTQLVIVDPADGVYDHPPMDAAGNRIPQPFLDAAQHFVCAGLRFTVYAPGADRFEVEIERASIPLPGEAHAQPVLDESGMASAIPLEYSAAGRLSVALNTPDIGLVPPGDYGTHNGIPQGIGPLSPPPATAQSGGS